MIVWNSHPSPLESGKHLAKLWPESSASPRAEQVLPALLLELPCPGASGVRFLQRTPVSNHLIPTFQELISSPWTASDSPSYTTFPITLNLGFFGGLG